MASYVYGKAKEKFSGGDIDWINDDIIIVATDNADYTPSQNVDEFYDDIPGGARVAVSAPLSGKTNVLGVMDASDITVTSVTGDEFEAITFVADSGVEGTSPVLFRVDNYTGLPATPNGGNILFQFPNTTSKIASF